MAGNVRGEYDPSFKLWWHRYSYFEHPEGTEILEKTLSCVNPALQLGLIVGIQDALLRTQCKTYIHTLQRVAFWAVPMTSIAAVFPIVTYMSTKFRGKDDPVNWGVGALATVPIFRAWWKTPFPITFQIAAGAVLLAVAIKGFKTESGFRDKYTAADLRALGLPQYDY